MKLDPPKDLRDRIVAALGPDTHFITDAGEPESMIGVRTTYAGNLREKTYACRTQQDVDTGWAELTRLAELRLVKP